MGENHFDATDNSLTSTSRCLAMSHSRSTDNCSLLVIQCETVLILWPICFESHVPVRSFFASIMFSLL